MRSHLGGPRCLEGTASPSKLSLVPLEFSRESDPGFRLRVNLGPVLSGTGAHFRILGRERDRSESRPKSREKRESEIQRETDTGEEIERTRTETWRTIITETRGEGGAAEAADGDRAERRAEARTRLGGAE